MEGQTRTPRPESLMSQDKTTGTGADGPNFFESLPRDLHEWAGRMGKIL